MLHNSYDHWRTTNSDDEFLGPDPAAEEELPEPVIDEEWNTSRGEYTTTVTFGSGAKYAVRQNSDDNWEVHGPDGFYNEFSSLELALNDLTDIEHWGW